MECSWCPLPYFTLILFQDVSAIFGHTVDQTISTLNTQVLTLSTHMAMVSAKVNDLVLDVGAIKSFLGVAGLPVVPTGGS